MEKRFYFENALGKHALMIFSNVPYSAHTFYKSKETRLSCGVFSARHVIKSDIKRLLDAGYIRVYNNKDVLQCAK